MGRIADSHDSRGFASHRDFDRAEDPLRIVEGPALVVLSASRGCVFARRPHFMTDPERPTARID
jgi:hypothetical protein